MSGHLIYTEVKSVELKKYQAPTSIGEQIENLRSLGLIINNDEEAGDFLNDVSYFRLIKAYSIGLKKKNGKYNPDVTFDIIKELYLFNCNFRQALFAQIEKVEINFRCRIANYFSDK
ncbi:MAG: Abi family protein, partial [Clostridia bacterium]|nr:Abi family protein [Clostridia bacterium]